MDIFEKCCDFDIADKIKRMGVYPYFHELQSRQDTEVVMEGKRRIMLGSNNYLGLTTHPEVIEAGKNALDKYGTGCSGSRFLNGTLEMHIELERELAEFLGKESALIFSTGFQTNLGIISAVAGRSDYILCDRENHASIYDGCRLSYAKMLRFNHSDMEHLEKLLQTVPGENGKIIVTDGVFSMGGDIAKLPEIVALAKKYGARVMVDDAHGLGILGKTGKGTADYFGLTGEVDIIMGTFSKSLASMGGYMAAETKVVEYVKHISRPFIFCASVPPANCATALAALRVLKSNPELVKRLSDLSAHMRGRLTEKGIKIRQSATPIIPIFTYDAENTFVITKELFEEGVYVNPVVPPATNVGESLLRTSYMATHTYELLDEAAEILFEVLSRHPEIKNYE